MRSMLLIGGSGAIGAALSSGWSQYNITSLGSHDFTLPHIPQKINFDADIVINLAGLSLLNDLHNYNKLSEGVILVNCLGSVNILNRFLPYMRERRFGRLIMMSSVCAEINLASHGVYSASKSFIDKLVKIAAIENAPYGVTVNSIQLGYMGIGMGADSEDSLIRSKNKPALKRFCKIDELRNAINFIIETEYYTGQNLRLDGGIK